MAGYILRSTIELRKTTERKKDEKKKEKKNIQNPTAFGEMRTNMRARKFYL